MYTLQNLLLLPLFVLRALAQASRTSPLAYKSIYHNHLRFALEEKFDKFHVSYYDKDAKASTPREKWLVSLMSI